MAINQRTLYGIQGGLNAPGGEGFLGGLFSGLSGTLGGFARYTDQTHEEERQRIRDMIDERRLRLAEASLSARLNQASRATAPAENYSVPVSNAEGDTETAPYPFPSGVVGPGRKPFLEEFGRSTARSLFQKPQTTARPIQPLAFRQEIQAIMAANPGMSEAEATNIYFYSKLNPQAGTVRVGPSMWNPGKVDTTTTTPIRKPLYPSHADPLGIR